MINQMLPVCVASDDVATFLTSKKVSFLSPEKMEQLELLIAQYRRACERLQEELDLKKDWQNEKFKPNHGIEEIEEMLELLPGRLQQVMKEISELFAS